MTPALPPDRPPDRPPDQPGSALWCSRRLDQLLAFARGSRVAHGFGWLDDAGAPVPEHPLELWINARMTYVFSLSGDRELTAHGVRALRETFWDREHGGWFTAMTADARPAPADSTKSCYAHAFVILAASQAGDPDLLDLALRTHYDRFWDARIGWVIDARSADWSQTDDYRGANAAMHTVEAWLAAAETTGDDSWRHLAIQIADRMIEVAADHRWRIVEHFTADLGPLPEHNAALPRDPFRPYGATPGHGFEWARLLSELGYPDPSRQIFDRAVDDALGDLPGLPYTTDWSGSPVVEERFHWVMCEAVMAAISLGRADLAQRWWQEIDRYFIDDERSWWHELGPDLLPSRLTWSGKPDAYHAVNALRAGGTAAPSPEVR